MPAPHDKYEAALWEQDRLGGVIHAIAATLGPPQGLPAGPAQSAARMAWAEIAGRDREIGEKAANVAALSSLALVPPPDGEAA